MSKLKKQLRAYFDENLSHTDQYSNIATKANLQSMKKEKPIFMSKKLLLRIALPCFLGLALLVTVLTIGLTRTVSDDPSTDPVESVPTAVIQMDVNPSLSLVVDNNNVVLSVYGENDEGKMIITDINLVGLSIDVAIEKIITEEVNTGYLLKGNVSAEENEISFVIEADTQEISTALKTKLNDVALSVCEKLNIKNDINFETLIEDAKQSLINRAIKLDPTVTKEELINKSNQELINYIALSQLEKAEIPTEELVALYDRVKTSQINLTEHEFIANTINAIDDDLYQEFKLGYSTLLNNLKTADSALETAYYELFVSTESEYQKAINSLTSLKQEVIKLKVELSEMEEGISKTIKETELKAKETALNLAENSLETVSDIAEDALNQLQTALDKILTEMEKFQDELPEEVKSVLTGKLSEVETKINEAKDNSFEYFEENFKEEIELAMQQVKEQKQALIDQLK